MTSTTTVEPHGGTLIDLLVDEEKAALLKDIAMSLPDVTLNDRQLCDLELLATGAFSPLTGFMTRTDYESVLDRKRLQSGILWPIPICLDVSDTLAHTLADFRARGLLDTEKHRVLIRDAEQLMDIAEGLEQLDD